jgi:hypothetical protein
MAEVHEEEQGPPPPSASEATDAPAEAGTEEAVQEDNMPESTIPEEPAAATGGEWEEEDEVPVTEKEFKKLKRREGHSELRKLDCVATETGRFEVLLSPLLSCALHANGSEKRTAQPLTAYIDMKCFGRPVRAIFAGLYSDTHVHGDMQGVYEPEFPQILDESLSKIPARSGITFVAVYPEHELCCTGMCIVFFLAYCLHHGVLYLYLVHICKRPHP